MSALSRTAPVAVALAGIALVGAGAAGVARVDAPLQAAATERPPPVVREDAPVVWHHVPPGDPGGCPPDRRDT